MARRESKGAGGDARRGRALFLTLGLTLTVVACELAARRFGPGEVPPRFEEMARSRFAGVREFRYHPERFYTTAPGNRVSARHLGRYATGSWPFRGRPVAPAPPGLLHVAVVADSSVGGTGVCGSESLPQRLADELARAGLPPERCLVSNFGVGGYTTPQVRLLLEEVLGEHGPHAIVLSCGGWNDQGPSLGVDDVELLRPREPAAWGSLLPGLERLVRARGTPQLALPPEPEIARIHAAWRRGQPPHGTKVPAAEVERQVAAMLRACAERGLPVVVVVPQQREATREAHPRCAQDAESVARAAREARAVAPAGAPVEIVDARALFEGTGWSQERLFLDFAHPSPDAQSLLAEAVARALAPSFASLAGVSAEGEPASDSRCRIVSVEPERASVLGDVDVSVRLGGWPREDLDVGELPAVIVGGVPLIDVVADGPVLRGRLPANGPGRHDVVVQGARACVALPAALELFRPRVVAEREGARLVGRVHARPDDRVRLYVSDALREEPVWWPAGPTFLTGRVAPAHEPREACGLDGSLAFEVPLEGELAAAPELFLQACVAPPGEDDIAAAGVVSDPVAVPLRR